jgi:tetratricopeptide (TPR) repeat protein
MSLLLDALKKAAEQKAANEDSSVTLTVSTVDDTIMLDDTQAVIDKTVAFNEDRTEYQEEEKLPLAMPGNSESVQQQASDDQNVSNSDKTVLDTEETIDNSGGIDAAYLAQMNKGSPKALTEEDVTAFMGEYDLPTRAAIFTRSPDVLDSDATLVATALEYPQQRYDNAELKELSLTLIELDDPTLSKTQNNAVTAKQITGSQAADTEVQSLAQNNHSTAELNRIDIPKDSASGNDAIIKPSVAFGGLARENSVTRQGSTSTRTYAPDNYGRTLSKTDKGDASQFFAGMKSESGVLMTPDYAKKVFISHSSGHRLNHYTIYSGFAAAILLVILILGLFEYQEKSINIDDSLRALKRDPMPNSPKRSSIQDQASLSTQTADAGVDAKTLALVNNASVSPSIAPQTTETIADDSEVSGTIKSVDDEVAAAIQPNPVTKTNTRVKKQGEKPSFQLSSKRSITEKNKRLKDAYAAYQRGDNNAALEKYNLVLTDDPQNRNALLARAAINVQSDNSANAIKDYQTLLIANPKDSLAMSSLISVASISPSKSESLLKGMIKDEPSSPHLNFTLANIYGAQNRWQEAQNLYFKALENNPDDPNYAYNLAVSLEHIAKPKVAIVYYQLALVNFNNGRATFNKAIVDKRVEILKQL